jgi:hypothetical protein
MEGLLRHFEELKATYELAPSNPLDPSQLPVPTSAQGSLRPPQGLIPATQPSQEPVVTPQRRTRQKAGQRAQVPTPPTTQMPILETQDSQPTVPSHAATQAHSQAMEDQESSHNQVLCVQINQGWDKLDKYYQATDDSTAYVASLVLHPAFTWKWLEIVWRDKPHWITSAKRKMLQLWQQYSSISIAPAQVSSTQINRRSTSRLFDLDDEEPQESVGNDYEAWCCKPRDRSLIDRPPLDYWTSEAIASTYPRLQKLALTIFSIPAMSDEPERVFSSCGIMIRPHRSSLSPKMIAASQCLRSWSREGLVTYNIFDRMATRLATLEKETDAHEIQILE